MKKLLIAAFACTAAMFIACGDDSSSTSSEVVESSSSGTNSEVSRKETFLSGNLPCYSIKDTTTMFLYSYEGPDSALTVTKYEYPIEYEEAVVNCFDLFADKTDEKLDCDSVITTFITTINPSQIMTYDALMSLREKECKSLF